jgi:hypothetical protein
MTDEPKKIYKKTAKETYGLTEKDLDDLSFTVARNPHYRSKRAYLYDEAAVQAISLAKHGDLQEYQEKKKAKIAKRQEKKISTEVARKQDLEEAFKDKSMEYHNDEWGYCSRYLKNGKGNPDEIAAKVKKLEEDQAHRREMMIAALQEFGLTLRSDSRLCADYIQNGVGKPAKIASIMNEMHFYFKYTDYEKICSGMHKRRRESRNYEFYNDFDDDDSDDDCYDISDQAKDRALKAWIHHFSSCEALATCEHLPASLLSKAIDLFNQKRR